MSSIASFPDKRGGILKPAIALMAFSAAAASLAFMLLVPDVMRSEIEARTGFPVSVESLSANPLGISVSGEGIVVDNPSAYGGGEAMLRIASLEADASLPALVRGEILIESLELRLDEAVLVTDERGRLNLDAFSRRLLEDDASGSEMPFFAENVRLVVQDIVFVDNSRLIPTRRKIRVQLDVDLTDLENPEEIFAPLRELAAQLAE